MNNALRRKLFIISIILIVVFLLIYGFLPKLKLLILFRHTRTAPDYD